ncbi:hypothetical protein HanOQP8_Chr06g0211961 [Helianthus annuus]|nr:hypothetical protein HanOQP8_Chr06g0211961 [Helianthus annuus]
MLFKVRMFNCYINALKKSNGDGRFGLSEKRYGIHGGSSPQQRFKILVGELQENAHDVTSR